MEGKQASAFHSGKKLDLPLNLIIMRINLQRRQLSVDKEIGHHQLSV
jgi:hypothetical protein